MLLPKLNSPEFFARMLLLYAEFDWRTVRNWKDLRTDPETGDVLTFATMAKNCGLLLDHKTAELTLDEARTQQLLTPYRARVLFCSVRCCSLSSDCNMIQSHRSSALQTGLASFVFCCISTASMRQLMAAYTSDTEPTATLRSKRSALRATSPCQACQT